MLKGDVPHCSAVNTSTSAEWTLYLQLGLLHLCTKSQPSLLYPHTEKKVADSIKKLKCELKATK